MTRTPFTRKNERSKELLGLLHTDVCGLMMICVIDGNTSLNLLKGLKNL